MLRSHLLAATIVASTSLLARPTAGQSASPPQKAGAYTADMSLPSAERDMKEVAVRVAPGVFAFHAPLGYGPAPLANETLIEQSDGLVLVDAGKTRGAGQRIVRLIRSVSPKPVKAVIITHWHQDHVLGLGPIIEAWPDARVVASVATRDAILGDDSYRGSPRALGETAARDSSRAVSLAKYADDYGANLRDPKLSEEERRGWANVVGVLDLRIADERGTYLVVPTVTFTDRYLIDDPVNPVEARSIGPAHTAGDIVVWVPKQRVVASGDIVVAPIPYVGTHVLEWPATLRKLEALHPKAIVPGHGPVETDETYVDRVIAALDEMRSKVEPLVADGPPVPDDSVVARIDFSRTRRLFAGGDRWLAYWFDQYFAPNAAVMYGELRELRAHATSRR